MSIDAAVRKTRDMGRPRGVTIRDVAARASVSVATVSRVFNFPDLVRDDTVSRVLDAARELSYVPHVGARSLSMRRTNTIGVLLPDLHGEFFSEVIRGIDSAARRGGYHLLVSGSHSDWNEMAAVLSATRGRVDGIIVMSPDLDGDALHSHLPQGLPAVLLNCPSNPAPSITIDNRGGAGLAIGHLAVLGHRRIAFIAGPERNADAQERLVGYREAIRRVTSSVAMELAGDFTEGGGYDATRKLMELRTRPTAIFAANDATAIGALVALREMSLAVPGEMAVIGFDDIPIARYVAPPLTTIGFEIASLGRRALELLLSILADGEPAKRSEMIPARLVIRESCGEALPSGGRRTRGLVTEKPATGKQATGKKQR